MIDQALSEELSHRVSTFRGANRFPGISAGIIVGQVLAWTANVGYVNLATAVRPTSDTLYRIASITKTFTATAIVQLRDEGTLDLDDPLVRFIPEFAAVANPFGRIEQVTIRRLLRHTSGLQGEVPMNDPRAAPLMTRTDVLAALDRVSVVIPPDTANKYSNLGFVLLGEVVRRVSGREYGDYLRDEILGPLRMASTSLAPTGEFASRCATGHDRWDLEERLHETIADDESEGDGGLWSTVDDLARWLALQLRTEDALVRGGEQILSGRSLAEMQRPAFVAEPDLHLAQGLGWRMIRRGDTVFVQHGGVVDGYTARVEFSPDDRVGVIVLTNGIGYPRGVAVLAAELLDLGVAAVRRRRAADGSAAPPPPTPDAWSELIGWYRDRDVGGHVRIAVMSGRLTYSEEGTDNMVALDPTDDPLRFTFRDGRPAGEALRFLRGADGRIDALNAAGYPMDRLGTNTRR